MTPDNSLPHIPCGCPQCNLPLTAVGSFLTCPQHGQVSLAAQFVEWDKPDHQSAQRVVRDLAFQLEGAKQLLPKQSVGDIPSSTGRKRE
jgi:hypothetical protein